MNKTIFIPVPKELAKKVRGIVPSEAIIPTINKERWAFCIVWKSHREKAQLTNMLKRHGLRLRHEGVWEHRCVGWHSCCCECDGCYRTTGFWHVARAKEENGD